MQDKLYKDHARAQQVICATQLALTDAADRPAAPRLQIAPETLAGTISMWSARNVRLRRRATALVEAPCRQLGIPIQRLGDYPLFSQLKLVRGDVTDVVIVPAEHDPLIVAGKFPLPVAVRTRLRAMERAGVPFELLRTYIAHEVPRGSVEPGGPLPLEVVLPPVPAQAVRTSDHLGVVAYAATVSLLRGLRRSTRQGLLGLSGAALAAGSAAVLMLDPLIFAALPNEHGTATWFVLAQWVW